MHPPFLAPRSPTPFALFDDNLAGEGDLLLHDLVEAIHWTAPAEVHDGFRRIREATARGHWVALAAAYELGHALEPRLRSCLPAGDTPLLSAWVFRQATHQAPATTAAQLEAAIAGLGPQGTWAGFGGLTREWEAAAHQAAVEDIRRLIAAGDCYQVNLTFGLTGQLWGQPLALYRLLREAQPVRYGAFIRHPGGHILSRSPELFVERRGRRLTCKPMKGTAPRHSDPTDLLGSAKDRAENLMIVDLIRNDLGRLAPPGGVHVERLFEAEAYPSVWQLTSTVSAEPVDAPLEAVLRALFPCGSVTGAPKIRAMEIIHALEGRPRGLYCGALGWLAPGGEFRFNVPIRTLSLDARGRGRLGVGGGIVFDSEPEREWQECLLKGRFLTGLPRPLRLIETLRREPHPADPYPLLAAHLERLAASAAWFGLPCDREAVRTALGAVPGDPAGQPQRVRLTLGARGEVEVTHAPLPDLAPGQTVVLSPHRLRRDDPLLRHKTTARHLYDSELAGVSARGHFDALFCNEEGELCEGARSNVFLRYGKELLTPATDCGLLNGVLRRTLLARGAAREARLTLADLHAADAVFVGNALRGLIPVTLAGA